MPYCGDNVAPMFIKWHFFQVTAPALTLCFAFSRDLSQSGF